MDSHENNFEKEIKIVARYIWIGILLIFVLVTFFTGFYTVKEQQQAVVLTFGQPTKVVGAGAHFKIPFVQKVKKVNTTVMGFAIGYDEDSNQPTQEAGMITSDFNFVNVDFFIEWKVSDPVKALYNSKSPVAILNNCTQSAARRVIGGRPVDDVLTVGKSAIQASIKEIVMAEMETLDIGIQVVNITIQDAEPPTTEVMAAFKSVENAKQEKDTLINNANKYKNEKIPGARADADKITQEAEAEKAARINSANGQVARFNEMFSEYIKNPDITKKRLFFETMEEIMPDLEVIIEGQDGVQKIFPVKSFMGGEQ